MHFINNMAFDVKSRYAIENNLFPPLHTAVYDGDIDKVKSILSNLKTNEDRQHQLNKLFLGYTPLDIAIITQNEDIVNLLLQQPRIQVNILPGQGIPPLFYAAALPSSSIMTMLLQRDIDINYRDSNGNTALSTACQYGQAENMTILLGEDDIKTDVVVWNGRTLAHIACLNGHVNCLRVLVQHGLFVYDINDIDELNPIERACQYDQVNESPFHRHQKRRRQSIWSRYQ